MSVWSQIVANYATSPKAPKSPPRSQRELTEKKCTGCGVVKPIAEFYARVDHAPGLTISKCKPCYNAVQQRRREQMKKGAKNWVDRVIARNNAAPAKFEWPADEA